MSIEEPCVKISRSDDTFKDRDTAYVTAWRKPCGSEPARDSGVSGNKFIEWINVIASRLTPTGDLQRTRVLCSATKKATFSGRLFHWAQELLTAVDLIKNPTIVEVSLLHSPPVTKGLLHRQEIHFRETIGVLGQHRRITRSQVVRRRNFLTFR